MIQVGGHGDHICQCRTVTLTTDKVIPMQMDGEPCRLMPATIQIRCSHQALVVQKQGHQPTYTTRGPGRSFLVSGAHQTRLIIFVISLKDYQAIPDDAIALRQIAAFYGSGGRPVQRRLSHDPVTWINRKWLSVKQPEWIVIEHYSACLIPGLSLTLPAEIERITSEREDRREPKPLLSCSSTLDTKQCANVTSTMDLENEQLTHTIPLQQNNNQSDQDKAWHSENVRPRLATFRSISVVCDPREQNETLKSSSGVTGETTKTHRKTRSFDQTSESSMERVTDWLHVHSSCDDSICSSISERTYETELLPSDSERGPALSTNTERRDRAKYLETVDSLQIRLDRALLNASRKGNVQQIDALLEAGANILAVDERGRSSLHLTTKFGCDRAVRTLLKYGAVGIRPHSYQSKMIVSLFSRTASTAQSSFVNSSI
ncbi:unnamed protein product [Fasciola hepatica]|uniref:Ankyrin repeat protein n=1 Tax=Fasciola hepatica TaxID=6192 RepID=A0ABC9HIC5_FASHE